MFSSLVIGTRQLYRSYLN